MEAETRAMAREDLESALREEAEDLARRRREATLHLAFQPFVPYFEDTGRLRHRAHLCVCRRVQRHSHWFVHGRVVASHR